MAGKVINTVLNLKDNLSGGLVKAAKNTKGVTKEMVSATREVVRFKNKAVSAISNTATSFAKLGTAAAGAVAALAVKTGLSEAMDLEGYRLQLETATKDTQKASEIMRYSIDLANRTPFEGGELVEAASKFEAMGMAAQKWLPLAGDMAAATNKSFDQATEALIDAQTGELERLKEFGITKAKVVEQGAKLFSDVQLVNNKGQIVNQEKFNEALISLMQERFAGGMEKQAGTIKGLWSTVTGVTKSALASMAGITTDGSIRAGSALDILKSGVSSLAKRLEQWQQDGTLDALARKLDQGLATAVQTAGRAFDWVLQNGDTIRRWVVGLGSALAMVKTAKFVFGVANAVKTVRLFATVVGTFVATNPIVLVIGAVIAATSLLIANWDTVKETATALWENAKVAFGGIRDSVTGAFSSAREAVGDFFSWIGDKLAWLDQKIEGIPLLGTLYSGAKGVGGWVVNQIRGHALGTSYFTGGLTQVNERGGEILDLPSGTRIIPHDLSQRVVAQGQTGAAGALAAIRSLLEQLVRKGSGSGVVVYVTVQGNVIGNREYADSLGDIITKRILRALDNS